jgi:TubC N-terminal docking domain
MTAHALLSELRGLGVSLAPDGERLFVEAPVGVVTGELRAELVENKRALLELLSREGGEGEAVDPSGLAIRWSDEPGWIVLRDPATGEWHEVRASECLPSVVSAAEASRRSSTGTRR